MIDPKNPHRSPGGAYSMLQAACRTGDAVACDYVRANFIAPTPVVSVSGVEDRPEDPAALARQGVAGCKVRIDGRLSECKVIRSGGSASDGRVLASTADARYQPGTFRGEPFDSFVYLRYSPASAADGGS
jgi:hypothetical protein